MFQIVWKDKLNQDMHVNAYTEEEKDEIVQLLTAAGFFGTVYRKTERKWKVCKIEFVKGGKPYTYLTKECVPVGSLVVVCTSDGPQIVKVVDSGEMTNAELERICPLSKFKYISGIVN